MEMLQQRPAPRVRLFPAHYSITGCLVLLHPVYNVEAQLASCVPIKCKLLVTSSSLTVNPYVFLLGYIITTIFPINITCCVTSIICDHGTQAASFNPNEFYELNKFFFGAEFFNVMSRSRDCYSCIVFGGLSVSNLCSDTYIQTGFCCFPQSFQ